MTIEFKYSIEQQVMVKAIGMKGVIDAVSFDNYGQQYRVVYWNDAQRYAVWVYDWEIKE